MPSNRARAARKTRNLLMRCLRKSLSRPEQITVSEWAEKYRELDESSALPGAWRNNITPYLVGIMDAFNDPYIQHINFIKSTQVGGTEALINAVGWIITQNPSPTMIVYPTDDLAKDISNDKLKPAFRYTAAIAEQFKEGNSTEMNLKFKNMKIYLRSGGGASKLASKSIRYLFFDEIDKMGGASKKEASPYDLALERTKTFKHTRKIYTCSTPTIKSNYIYKIHSRADEQREYFVPCPHCGEYITLQWGQVLFDSDPDKKMTIPERAATAMYYCQKCGAAIPDKAKPKMLQRGEWRDVKGTSNGAPRRVSYHINALYSFFVSWRDAAEKWLEAQGDPAALQNFFNSWLGEPWEDTKIKTSEEQVLEHQADELAGVVPEWAQLITIGADVQRNSVYFDVVAFGGGYTHQSIMHGQILSLDELTPYIMAEYQKASGERLQVALSCVDSGDQTDKVYTYTYYTPYTVPVKGTSENLNHYRVTTINKVDKIYNGGQLSSLVIKQSNTTISKDKYATAWSDGSLVVSFTDGTITGTVTVEYDKVNPAAVTAADIIGAYDTTTEKRTGIEVVNDVYAKTGEVPMLLSAPKFSETDTVGAALIAKTTEIAGCFSAFALLDLACPAGTTRASAITARRARTDGENAAYFFPRVKRGENIISYSALAAAAIMYRATLTGGVIANGIDNLALSVDDVVLADGTPIFYNQPDGNELVEVGIITAIARGGRFYAWGNNSAAYPTKTNPDSRWVNMRLAFIFTENDFIASNAGREINPRTMEDLMTDENIKLGAWSSNGYIINGSMSFLAADNTVEDVSNGNYKLRTRLAPNVNAEVITNIFTYDRDAVAAAIEALAENGGAE